MLKILQNKMYIIYLTWLRYRIFYIKSEECVLNIINNIQWIFKTQTSDELCEIFIDCFLYFPLSQEELQKLSLLQQQYDNELGLYNYITFILWISSQYSIQEMYNKMIK